MRWDSQKLNLVSGPHSRAKATITKAVCEYLDGVSSVVHVPLISACDGEYLEGAHILSNIEYLPPMDYGEGEMKATGAYCLLYFIRPEHAELRRRIIEKDPEVMNEN